jgi:hypothetical protein
MWRKLLVLLLVFCVSSASLCWSQVSPSVPPSSSALPTLSDSEVSALLAEADSTIAAQSKTIDGLSLRLKASDVARKQLERDYSWLLLGFGTLLVVDGIATTIILVDRIKR